MSTADTTAPTITSIVRQTPSTEKTNADTLVYRVTFSEDVTNVGGSAFTVVGATDATVTNVTTVNAQTYDITVAEGDIASLNGAVALTVHSGPTIRDLANNTLGSFTPTGANESYTLDNTAPTVGITSNTAQLKAGQTANITFAFNEDPGATFTWDGSIGDVSVTGGTLSAISGSGLTRTATFTPTAGTDASTASITVGAGSYQDEAGNNGGAGATPTLGFDTKAPTVVSIDRQTPAAGTTNADSLVYRVTFSETVNNVLPSGFDVTGGSNAFVTHVQSVGGNAWDITVAEGDIANHNGPVTLAFGAGQAVKDSAGNALANTTPSGTHNPTYTLDNIAPTLTITSNLTSLPIGNTADITFIFNEDPGASFTWDGTVGDVVVSGGTLSAISGSGLTRTATFTPTANTNSTTASITVAAGTYTDGAGNNGGAGTTPSITFDTRAPTLASSTPLDNATGVSVSNNLVLSFSENVTAGEGLVELRKTSDNTLVEEFDVNTGEGSLGGTVALGSTTLTLNPHNDLGYSTGYYLLTEYGIVRDGLGNYFTGITNAEGLNFTTGAAPSGGGGGDTPPPPTTVDGTPVTTTTGQSGSTTTTVPVVAPNRTDTLGSASALADIPLVKDAGGQSLLQVSVPAGVGFTAEGPATGAAAQTGLLPSIEKLAGTAGSDLNAQAQAFLATLGSGTPLTVQTITPTTGNGFNPNTPLVITGGTGNQAVVVDARSLPSGTVIRVDNVEFVAIVGAVRVVGGAGQNVASGDGGAQWIVLGPDDDVIHGGAGNDVVGSEAGDDQVYGDAGDDIVFGGAGNDLLSGGTGSDKLNGGTGFDVAIQEGARTDYTVILEGAGIKLTHTASGVSDWLVDVEQVRFATGPSLTVAHSAAEEAAAYLFQKWLGRDLSQGEGAAIQTLAGQSAEQVATLFAQVFPQQSAGKTPAQLLEGMSAAGAIRVDAVRDVIVSGDAGNNTITPALGLARYVDGGAGIDTVVIPATLGQTFVQHNASGSYTLQRLTDGAMLDVTHVERVTLTDTKLALDITGNGHAGEAAKLLGALAGPASLTNKGVVGEVIRLLDAGASSQAIAGVGLQLLGANTPTQVAQTLWTNVTGRAGTAPELKILTDIMASGVSAADLVVMAAHLDATAVRIDLVGLAAKGIEFA